MAKTTIWVGSVSSLYETAGNWSNGLPASTDTVIIPATTTVAPTMVATQVAAALDSFNVLPGCTVQLGTAAAPLMITAATCNLFGSGAAYLDSTSAATLGTIVTNCPNLNIGSAGAAITKLTTLPNAVVKCLAAVTDIEAVGGTITVGTAGVSAVAVGIANIFSGATVIYNTSGTLTTGHIFGGGTLDGSQDTRPTTITTLNQDKGGTIIEALQRFAPATWNRQGGRLVIQ